MLARVLEELRRERDRLQAAVESSLDALFLCEALKDEQGDIEDFIFTYLNRNVEDLVKIPRNELLSGRMCKLLPVNLSTHLFEAYKQAAITGVPFLTEIQIEPEPEESGWLRIQAVRLDEGVAITASDMSKQKALRSRLKAR